MMLTAYRALSRRATAWTRAGSRNGAGSAKASSRPVEHYGAEPVLSVTVGQQVCIAAESLQNQFQVAWFYVSHTRLGRPNVNDHERTVVL
jgi:hypothetical protein